MEYTHTKCGGIIDRENRKCLGCKKEWTATSFIFAVDIRPVKPIPKPITVMDIRSQSLVFASKLPRWPLWARILSSAIVLAIIIAVIVLVSKWLRSL